MQIPHYNIALDVNSKEYQAATIIARVGDKKSRYIDIELRAGNERISLNKERVTLTVADENETIALTDCAVSNNIITAELTENMVAKSCKLKAEITVYGTNKEVITAVQFDIDVVGKLSTEVVERENDFSALQTALADVASTSNRINEVSSRIQPITLGGTGAATSLEAAKNLQNAYIGVATAIPENSDLDSYTTIGTYDIAHASIATLSNTPFSAHSYKLYVIACGASSYVYQLAVSPYYGEICIRDYNSSTKAWASWNKIVSQPAATDETGTWTPAVEGDGITVKSANYVYRGNTVTVTAQIELGAAFTGKSLTIGGLPIIGKKPAALSVFVSGSYIGAAAMFTPTSKNITLTAGTALTSRTVTITGTYII